MEPTPFRNRLGMTRRQVVAAGGLMLAGGGVRAQTYPAQPIKYLVGFQAGGGSDQIGRSLATVLSGLLGQAMPVENKAGATGLLALDALNAAPPDGHTVLQLADTTTNSVAFSGRSFDFDRRFQVVGRFVVTPLVLVVNPKLVNVRNVSEFVEYARRNPGLAYTSSGPGSPSNLMMEALSKQLKLSMTHIPYKGSGPAILDVIGGQLGVMVADGITARQHIRSGALRPVAVTSSFRTPVAPGTSTATEQGFPTLSNEPAVYLVVHPKTPSAVVARLRQVLSEATLAEAKAEEQRMTGLRYAYLDGPQARDQLQKDFDHTSRLIKEFNIKVTE